MGENKWLKNDRGRKWCKYWAIISDLIGVAMVITDVFKKI